MWTDCGACKRALRIFWEVGGEKWSVGTFSSKKGKDLDRFIVKDFGQFKTFEGEQSSTKIRYCDLKC